MLDTACSAGLQAVRSSPVSHLSPRDFMRCKAGDAMGLTPSRSADLVCQAVARALLDATTTAATPAEDVVTTSETVVQKVTTIAETSADRMRQCAVKSAAHAAATAKVLRGEAAAAPEAAAAAAAKVGHSRKLYSHDIQSLAVSEAGHAAMSNAIATGCSLGQAVLEAGHW